MAVYRFKISFEDYDVIREIDIKSNQTFETLHRCIHQSIEWSPEVPSSFYISNDHWLKGEEIAYLPSEKKINKGVKLMKDAKLNKFVEDPHQKFYYTSNFEHPFDFQIELIKIILDEESDVSYPFCFKSIGVPPKQFADIAKEDLLLSSSLKEAAKDEDLFIAQDSVDQMNDLNDLEATDQDDEEDFQEDETDEDTNESEYEDDLNEKYSDKNDY